MVEISLGRDITKTLEYHLICVQLLVSGGCMNVKDANKH